MVQPIHPFKPAATGGTSLAVSGSSDRVAISNLPTVVRVRTKPADADCFLEFGNSSVTASTTTGYALGAGAVEFLKVPIGATHLAAITASGTATLYVHSGEGG